MNVFINGQALSTNALILSDILQEIKGLPTTYAVAVNGKIVPKSKHHTFEVDEGAKIEVFALMAGG